MNVPVTLQQYAQLVQRINAEVANHLSSALRSSTNIKLVPASELDCGAVFGVRNSSRQVTIKSALVPFSFDQSNSLLVEVDRAVIVASGASRQLGRLTWTNDSHFADNGVLTVCAPSLDEEAIAHAVGLIAEEIKSHLAFERTFARTHVMSY